MGKANWNRILTEVGAGTPLGKMMRRYWHPIALSREVEPDGKPLRAKLLGQNFVVFRDTHGAVGVLDEACPHRGVSMALGRNEEGGLRCLYHGWKFAASGELLETPYADCRFKDRVKNNKYPVQERSGMIWTYIGPAEKVPPFREFAHDHVPEESRVILHSNMKCSYLPLYEGGMDTGHAPMLHTNVTRPAWVARNSAEAAAGEVGKFLDDHVLAHAVHDTDFGFYCGFFDNTNGPNAVAHGMAWPGIMPNIRIIPLHTGLYLNTIEVPRDDFETTTYFILYAYEGAVAEETLYRILGFGSECYDPVTGDIHLDWSNNMGQDRSSLEASWTGMAGIEMEDMAMSMTLTDWDRSNEKYLMPGDVAVIRLRNRLLDCIRLNEGGGDPLGLHQTDLTGVGSYNSQVKRREWLKPLEAFQGGRPSNAIIAA